MSVTAHAKGWATRRAPNLEEFFTTRPAVRFARGAYVCMPADPADRLFMVRSGCLKLKAYSREGGERILMYVYPGQTFGEPGVLVGRRVGIAAEAMVPSTISWLTRTEVDQMIDTNPAFARALLEILAVKMRWRSSEAVSSSFRTAVEQVAAALLTLAPPYTSDQQPEVCVPITHSELASFIGISRVSVTNSLAQLETERLVRRYAKSIGVPDLRALSHWLESRPAQ